MTDVRREYFKAMRGLWGKGHWVVWQPTIRVRLGDVGLVHRRQLVAVENITSRSFAIESVGAGGRDELVYDSNGRTSISFKAAGATSGMFSMLSPAEAGARISFSKEATVFVALSGVAERRIRNIPELAVKIIQEYWNGWWQEDFVVVTHVVQARQGTVLIAADGSSSVELRAAAAVGSGQLSLVDLATSVDVAHASGLGYKLVCQNSLTPFCRALGVRRSFWGELQASYPRSNLESGGRLPTDLLDRVRDDPETVIEECDSAQPDAFADRTALGD